MDIRKLRIAMQAMSDPKNNPTIIAKNLGVTSTTLYTYINGDGSPKELGIKIIKESENKIVVSLSVSTDKKKEFLKKLAYINITK